MLQWHICTLLIILEEAVFIYWFIFSVSLWQEQCIPLVRKNGDFQSARNTKKLVNRMHDNIIFCLENLGIWGAFQVRSCENNWISCSVNLQLRAFPLQLNNLLLVLLWFLFYILQLFSIYLNYIHKLCTLANSCWRILNRA